MLSQTKYLHIENYIFVPLSIYLVFLPLERQRRFKQTKLDYTTRFFYSILKETTHKLLKEAASNYTCCPPRLKLPFPWLGASHQEVSTQVRQQEELVGASLLRPIRTNRSSYVNAKDLIQC